MCVCVHTVIFLLCLISTYISLGRVNLKTKLRDTQLEIYLGSLKFHLKCGKTLIMDHERGWRVNCNQELQKGFG